jgi:TonB family protein
LVHLEEGEENENIEGGEQELQESRNTSVEEEEEKEEEKEEEEGEEQVEEVILRNMGQITYCYEKGLQIEPDLKGRVAVNFVIGSSGQVSTARVQHSSVDSSKLEGCIVGRLKGFKFPRPVAGVNVQVQYPFSFRRVSAN